MDGCLTYLLSDVLPRTRGTKAGQLIIQSLSHRSDAAAHQLQFGQPVSREALALQDGLDNGRSVPGSDRVFATDELGQISEGLAPRAFRRIVNNQVEGSRSLSIETKTLGEGLGDAHLHGWLVVVEVADGPRVLDRVSRCETLVGVVEDGEELFPGAELGNGDPLLLGGIQAGWVVGTGVQKDGVAGLGLLLQHVDHGCEVESAILIVVVRVCARSDAGGLPDDMVVGPGWVGHPDAARTDVVGEESGGDVVGTGSRDGLHTDHAGVRGLSSRWVGEGGGEEQIAGGIEELVVALDGDIVVASNGLLLVQSLLNLSHHLQGP